ncbi:MAG: HAMP domain-containing histidine kinase [Saprospiraceae bacterium]|nr:HAMP domain-containing histidine kinase [Bacteroidia bacterium]NNF20509.1 HAMP domain-containing histidine kinase [Saprospiraceae bacterium]
MNKKIIWAIIILMSAALFGIAVTQFVWIKAQVDLDEKNFDDKVVMAMNKVKSRLQKDTETKDFVTNYWKPQNRTSTLSSENAKLISNILLKDQNYLQFADILRTIDPEGMLENIDKENLDRYIKEELEDQGISLKYDYGVYSNRHNDFVIRNGNFAVQVEGNSSPAYVGATRGLYDSKYKVQLFNDEESLTGYLKIFFPSKRSWLWASVLPSMLSSLLFTTLILFCFAYTIFIIFRQKKVSEMKTDFINNMTHEFKTPIATISLATDSITNSSVINDVNKVKRFTGIIKQENKRMLNQVEKVLQMARIDKQDFELKITNVNINDVVFQASENTRLKVIKRDGYLITQLNAVYPNIEGDLTHVSNIVHNLLDNAEKYSKEKPEITITTENYENGVNVIIQDNGIGMSKESLKHIFDKFYRVHTGNRHDIKGFGLGLSYVKALMNAHKGMVKVESELDKGSTFTLFFPFKFSD